MPYLSAVVAHLAHRKVVVLNKIDLPHVKSKQAELEATIKVELGHTRFISIRYVFFTA